MPDGILPGHRDLTLRWLTELGRLADELLGLLAIGLGLDSSYFTRLFGDRPMSLTKMIHYLPTPVDKAGVNAHHDTGFLTLRAPGPTAGLQVLNTDEEWINVPSVPGGLVVNLGEMLQAMTSNYFVATAHRETRRHERLSTAHFHGPSLDTQLTQIELPQRFHDAMARSERHRQQG
jgi:isopenicillin N synthase-like dioxygenase